MPKNKKKFIDRKNALTFNLVYRSQRDPLIADETAPQRVLVPVNAVVPKKEQKEPDLTPEQRKEEQRKYGIFYDDDYDYLQHLKDSQEVVMVVQPKPTKKTKGNMETTKDSTFTLPSSVFASETEEDVGLLNKAAEQGLCLDVDPDVVAALDEDFCFDDPENQLEDNFIELAMGEAPDDDMYSDYDDDDDQEKLTDDENGSDRAFCSEDSDNEDQDRGRPRMPVWDEEGKVETKSRFSQYSMSSSVIRRNEGLSLLDKRFEKMFEEYDDTEIGPLDLDEIEGFVPNNHGMLMKAAQDFEESQKKYQLDKPTELARIKHLQEIEEESDEELVAMEVEPKLKWDCESILSTYSNLYNHPKTIEEPRKPRKIKINPKTGIPEYNSSNKLTVKSLAKFDALHEEMPRSEDEVRSQAQSVLSTLSVLSIRPKDESSDEKKERKRLLREYRKERRIEKKANREAFKEEKKRQEKIMMNNRNNLQGNRIC